jgi:hypothetical protein
MVMGFDEIVLPFKSCAGGTLQLQFDSGVEIGRRKRRAFVVACDVDRGRGSVLGSERDPGNLPVGMAFIHNIIQRAVMPDSHIAGERGLEWIVLRAFTANCRPSFNLFEIESECSTSHRGRNRGGQPGLHHKPRPPIERVF